jgi:serine-type D-Ala-D-Ala carboxypeptidase/endopeptidase (penicillin-binding protein 4)
MSRLGLWRGAALALLVSVAGCASTSPSPQAAPPAIVVPQGARAGVVVTKLSGDVVVSERAAERFIPASNTKLFTAAAALHLLDEIETPDASIGTSVSLMPGESDAPLSLVLTGRGDPAMRDAVDCVSNCLHQLADAVAARGIDRVADVYSDDSAFPYEPWGMGWSWNNLPFYFGAPVSALTVNRNAVTLRVAPGATAGAPVKADWAHGDDVMRVVVDANTSAAGGENLLSVMRLPGSGDVRLTGTLPIDTPVEELYLSVPEPRVAAAERFIRLLRERGVTVDGKAKVRLSGDRAVGEELARLTPPPLIDSVVLVLEDSDNLSAELVLRHLETANAVSASQSGLDAVNGMLDEAGIGRPEVELFDGSGLSPYNRITPGATVRFLIWTQSQPWGGTFRAALPVGGKTGSLARRFKGTPLEGRIFAKTGTVQGVNALSGFLIAASGETLVFSVIVNDRPAEAKSTLPAIDAFLLKIAAEN